jgi:hypothetical protein
MPLRSSAAAFPFGIPDCEAQSGRARSHGLSIGLYQCEDPSSLLLVANKIDAAKTTIRTGTTKNGEVMFIRQSP